MASFPHATAIALAAACCICAPGLAVSAEAVMTTGEELLAKKAEFNGKTITTECILTLADDSMGSMCAYKGKGNVLIDAKTWTPEAKALIMGACNPATVAAFCTIVVTGTVDASGSVIKLKNVSATTKSK